ncbi:MAG: bifunctional DNA primase/polymerase [Actinomycetota bacterium]|nr:bifunctional DNA primase/polymerase [Actinomycetota bacterium]
MLRNEKRRPVAEPDAVPAITSREQEMPNTDDTSTVGHFAHIAPTDPEQIAIETDVELAAHTYVEHHGLSVFPCEPNGKAPLTRRGFRDATDDHTQISEWFRRWPDANLAAPVPSGQLVIDADLYKRAAHDTLAALEAMCGPLPACPTVRTPNGGVHYKFTVSVGSRFRGIAGPGVDLRAGDRNYVVLPPSRIGDRRYEWVSGEWDDPPELPVSWLAALEYQRPTLTTRTVPGSWVERLAGVRPESVTIADLDAFLNALPAGSMDLAMAAAVDSRMVERMRATAHDTLVRAVYRVVALGAEGHPGAVDAMARVLSAFVDENMRRERRGLDGVRSAEELESEMLRAVFGAIVKVSAE